MAHSITIPFQRGDTFEVDVTRLNDDGEGVASVAGVTTFIPRALPGERVEIRISDVQRRFARATLIGHTDVISEHRQDPACQVFGQCGGCQLQHLSYQGQLDHKRNMVAQALARMAKLPEVPVNPTCGMDSPWRYRNQVQVPLKWEAGQQQLVAGFFSSGSHELVPTATCHLEPLAMEETIDSVVRLLNERLGPEAASVHHLVARYSFTTRQQMVVLCLRQRLSHMSEIANAIAALPSVVSVASTVQPQPYGPIWGKAVEVVAGESHLTETIGDLEFLISPRSFFQVNTLQANVLYQKAVEYAQLQPHETVLDAYCGTGTIGLMMAHRAARVTGIESVASAIADARKNAAHNGIANATFHVGEVERLLPRMVANGERFDVAVVDPPRKGCDPLVLQALMEAKPNRIVYVSCNHITLARDLRLLVDGGYEVREVQPVDMFPQTGHVECVAQLIRSS